MSKRTISSEWKTKIIKRQRGYCAGKNCAKLHNGKKLKIDLYANFDHTKPLAMDGKNILSNIKALCPGCHAEKTRSDREKIRMWKEKNKKKKTKRKTKNKKIETHEKFVVPKFFYKPPIYKG